MQLIFENAGSLQKLDGDTKVTTIIKSQVRDLERHQSKPETGRE